MSINKNIINSIVSQIPILVLQFATGIFLTRYLGPYYKGVQSIILANLTLLSLFIGLSVNSGIVYFISSKKIEVGRLKAISYLILLGAIILGGLIVFIPNPLYNNLMPDSYTDLFYKLYIYIGFLISIYSNIIQSFHQGLKDYTLINRTLILQAILSAIAFSSIYYFRDLTLVDTPLRTVLLISLIIQLIVLLVYFIPYKQKIKVKPSFTNGLLSDFNAFMKYIGIGHISNVINFFNYRIDLWFLNSYYSAEQVGYYSLAVNLSNLILFIATPLSNVAFPYFTEANKQKKIMYLKYYSKLNSSILLAGGAIGSIMGFFLIPILYGIEFSPSLFPFVIMVFATISMGINKLFSVYFASNNQIKYNLYSTIIGVFVTISTNIYLIPRFGIIGAAISSFLTYTSILLYSYYKLPKNYTFENYFLMNLFGLKGYLLGLKKITNPIEKNDKK